MSLNNFTNANNKLNIENKNIYKKHMNLFLQSDRRIKSDIKDIDIGLNFINKLKPVSYYRNNDKDKKIEYGLIAQDLEDVLIKNNILKTGLVEKDEKDPEKMYSIRYNDLIAILIKSTQELKENIDIFQKITNNLNLIVESQQKTIQDLNNRISKLEKI